MTRFCNIFSRGQVVFYLLVVVVFAACTVNNRPEVATGIDDTTFTDVPAGSVTDTPAWENDGLTTLYHFNTVGGEVVRVAVSERSEHSPYFLSGDTNLIVAIKYLDNKVIEADTLLNNEYVYTEIDSARIMQDKRGNNDYLLLTAKETFKGQAIDEKTVDFILLDVNNLDHYTLAYEGTSSLRCYDCIDGTFKVNSLLNKKPDISQILLQYANGSKWVYKPATQEEKDTRYYSNYEQKWEENNHADNRLANGHGSIPETIYSTYYKEDIFKLTAAHAGEADIIENERFKIVSYFRGNILGFDKKRQVYFPILVESCFTGCNKKVKFISPESIEVFYDEYSTNEVYTVDLGKIRFN